MEINTKQLIIKYITREINSDELAELYSWINSDKVNKKKLFELKDIYESISYKTISQKANSEQELKKLFKIINKQQSDLKPQLTKVTPLKKKRIKNIYKNILKIVAIFIFSVCLNVSWNVYNKKVDTITYTTINVPYGSKSEIKLPDGTTVMLNSGSELRYPNKFSAEVRNINLKGEAYFQVKHNKNKPFVVHTKYLDVHVLGTKFNIMAYNTYGRTEVYLEKGKIAITKPGNDISTNSIILHPNEKIIRNHFTGKYKIERSELLDELCWMKNNLIFKSISFAEIMQNLEKRFDYKIYIKDEKLKKYKYSGKFVNNQSIVEILEAIKLTTPIVYSANKKEIFVGLRNKD